MVRMFWIPALQIYCRLRDLEPARKRGQRKGMSDVIRSYFFAAYCRASCAPVSVASRGDRLQYQNAIRAPKMGPRSG